MQPGLEDITSMQNLFSEWSFMDYVKIIGLGIAGIAATYVIAAGRISKQRKEDIERNNQKNGYQKV